MPNQNAEVVRRSIEAWNRSDWDTLESQFWPDIEMIAPKEWPEAEDAYGWPAYRRQIERLKDSWVEESVELISLEEVSTDLFLAQNRWRVRGDASGIELDMETWMIWRFRGDRAARVEYYLDRDEAVNAAGN